VTAVPSSRIADTKVASACVLEDPVALDIPNMPIRSGEYFRLDIPTIELLWGRPRRENVNEGPANLVSRPNTQPPSAWVFAGRSEYRGVSAADVV
jgi:hypothetical protein